jgi:hypothetical protein
MADTANGLYGTCVESCGDGVGYDKLCGPNGGLCDENYDEYYTYRSSRIPDLPEPSVLKQCGIKGRCVPGRTMYSVYDTNGVKNCIPWGTGAWGTCMTVNSQTNMCEGKYE